MCDFSNALIFFQLMSGSGSIAMPIFLVLRVIGVDESHFQTCRSSISFSFLQFL